jgi:hypothetical protein
MPCSLALFARDVKSFSISIGCDSRFNALNAAFTRPETRSARRLYARDRRRAVTAAAAADSSQYSDALGQSTV